MPYKLIWESGNVVFEYSGVVSQDDVIQSNMDFYDDPRSNYINYQLVDFTQAEALDFSELDIRIVSKFDKSAVEWVSLKKVAMLPGANDVRHVADIYARETTDAPWEFETFHDANAAREWLAS